MRETLRQACRLLTVAASVWLSGSVALPHAIVNPGEPGPCAVSSRIVYVNSTLETHIYYASGNQCSSAIAAPYAAIGFAHGFSLFGLSNGAQLQAGTGEHLASWGYVVAIPVLADNVQQRITSMQDVLSYLQAETNKSGSFLYQKVDTERLAVAGHSFGGATALAVAARDHRVKAVVALDPVYHQGGPFPGEEPEIWNPDAEGPNIHVPTCILGAPASNCNSEADYAEIYPFVGAVHRASFFIANASHCDFMDPGHWGCSLICGGTTDPARTQLIQKYMTAWFNYYLHLNTGCYDYVYGAEAEIDMRAGRIQRQADTAPHGLTGRGLVGAIALEWELYEHPIVAGYNIYRCLPGASCPPAPYARLGRTSQYVDTGVVVGQVYSYTLRSYDPAGNVHQPSEEVSATAQVEGASTPTATPIFTPGPTATSTHTTVAVYLPLVAAIIVKE